MSFAARLIHSLAIVTPTTTGAVGEYGQPVPSDPTVRLVAGLVQPLRQRELLSTVQAGAEIATHRVFLLPQVLTADAYIRFEPDDGDRYQITGIANYEFGRSPHLEVDCQRIISAVTVAS